MSNCIIGCKKMQVGDLIKFKRPIFGSTYGLVRYVRTNEIDTGQIGIFCASAPRATIPWARRNEYIEVVNEVRRLS